MHKRCKSIIGLLCCSLICANAPMVYASSPKGVTPLSNVKEVRVGDTLLSAPVVATIATIAVGAGITLTTDDDIYDIVRLVYDSYGGQKEDIENIFNSSVSIGKDGVVKVGKEFLDICKSAFDALFYSSADHVSSDSPINVGLIKGYPNMNGYWAGVLPGNSFKYSLIPNKVVLKDVEIGSRAYNSNGLYYVERISQEQINVCDLNDNIFLSFSYKKGSIKDFVDFVIYYKDGRWCALYDYINNNGYQLTGGSAFTPNGLPFSVSLSVPYIPGTYNWDNIGSNTDNEGNVGVYVPGDASSLVGIDGGSTIKGGLNTPLYDLIVDGVVELPTVSNPSISVDTSAIFLPEGSYKTPVVLNQEATVLDVVVPLSLPINVDGEGVVTVADNVQILNNSIAPVEVSSVSVTPKDDWDLVSFDKDFSGAIVGLKEFGFKVDNEELTSDSVLTLKDKVINGGGSIDLSYDASISPQKDAIVDSNIADIVFTIDWMDGGN